MHFTRSFPFFTLLVGTCALLACAPETDGSFGGFGGPDGQGGDASSGSAGDGAGGEGNTGNVGASGGPGGAGAGAGSGANGSGASGATGGSAGEGGSSLSCGDLCLPGPAHDKECGPCQQEVCAAEPACCDSQWSETCAYYAQEICAAGCGIQCLSCGDALLGGEGEMCPGEEEKAQAFLSCMCEECPVSCTGPCNFGSEPGFSCQNCLEKDCDAEIDSCFGR